MRSPLRAATTTKRSLIVSAVKLLRPEFGQDPDFLARFRDEARSAASLSHPNIVAVHDFGQDESGPYIVIELVEGRDLAS